jgi:hypothetical protein
MDPRRDAGRRVSEAQREIAIIDINPSSDANVLFEAFAKRFSVMKKGGDHQIPSPSAIRRIVKSGMGSPFELAFVLLNLFALNGIDAERVDVYSDKEAEPHDNFELDNIEHVLVYVPSLDRYFDPTSRISEELRESAETWLEEKNRMYRRGIPGTFAYGYYAKRSTLSK